MATIKELVFGDLQSELNNTRKLLECVPDEHFDWRPHEKSWHIGGLANHLSNLPKWQAMVLTMDGLDLGSMPPNPEPPTGMGPILEAFDENRREFEAAIEAMTEEGLSDTWTLSMGDHEIMSGTRVVVLRQMGVNHTAHHRGQLTVYLRLLDIPVPQTFGPTADDKGGFG